MIISSYLSWGWPDSVGHSVLKRGLPTPVPQPIVVLPRWLSPNGVYGVAYTLPRWVGTLVPLQYDLFFFLFFMNNSDVECGTQGHLNIFANLYGGMVWHFSRSIPCELGSMRCTLWNVWLFLFLVFSVLHAWVENPPIFVHEAPGHQWASKNPQHFYRQAVFNTIHHSLSHCCV